MGKKGLLSLVLICVLVGSPSVVGAAGRQSARCSKAGKVINISDIKMVCGRVNRKLSWILISKVATTTQVVAPVTTTTTVATATTAAATTTTVAATTTTTTTTTTTVSTAIPKIVSVAIRQPGTDGIYHVGQFVRVAFVFSLPVTVSGAPYVMLDSSSIGKTPFLDGNGTTNIMFSYTVATGDVDNSGVGLIANSIVLNGGTIKSATGVSADLTHARISRSGSRLVGP
ncbi:MAG: hypothetical protein NT119_01915 [Actinobacteria bacterium]|nr:hypothetical protein [Actinomycetota bacterium]